MYDNAEQLSLVEPFNEHWDKYFSSPLQLTLPENDACLASVGTDTLMREYASSYPK
jgi:hypothetical protein